MKYSKKEEFKKLCSKLSIENEKYKVIFELVVKNVDTYLKLASKGIKPQLGYILKITIGKKQSHFDNICAQFLEKGRKYHIEKYTAEVIESLKNIRYVLTDIKKVLSNFEEQHLNPVIHNAVVEHVLDVAARAQPKPEKENQKPILHQQTLATTTSKVDASQIEKTKSEENQNHSVDCKKPSLT